MNYLNPMTKKEKRQLLIEYLKEEIGYSIKMYENPSIKDWCTGTGILISMDDASLIDERFRIEAKKRKRIGLRGYSKMIGISASTMSRIINGSKPDIDTILIVCNFLNLKIDKFFKNK